MAFTSFSLAPIEPLPGDERAIMSVAATTEAGAMARDTLAHMPDFMVQSLTQLSWLRKCGVDVAGFDARPVLSSGAIPSSMQPLQTTSLVQHEGSPPSVCIFGGGGSKTFIHTLFSSAWADRQGQAQQVW